MTKTPTAPQATIAAPASAASAAFVLPSPWFFCLWIVTAGALAKLGLALSLLVDDDSATGFFWAPLGILSELLLGLLPVAVSAVVGSRGWRGVVAALLSLVVVVIDVAWQSVSLVSWLVSRTGIRWERMRGDEGVTFADAHLVDNIDRYPGYAYAVIALVVGALVARALAHRLPAPLTRGWLVVAAVALGATCLDGAVLRPFNHGVGAQPLVYLGETWLQSLSPPTPLVLQTKIPVPTTTAALDRLLLGRRPQPAVPPRPPEHARNVIVFFAEGIAREHTSLGGSAATPHLARRAQQGGLELTHHYSPFHKSIAAIFSMACSDWPPPSSKSITEIRPRIDCGEFSEVMAQNDVHTGLFHGGDFGFYDKLALLGLRGYEVQRDRQALLKPGDWQNKWGIDDRVVVDATLSWIDSLPKDERFAAWIIPITAHYPYGFPPDHERAFPGFAGRSRYLSAVHFVDEAFERLMTGLEQRGLADDTLVIFTGDHGETIGEHPRKSPGRRLVYEPSVRVPLLMLAPKLFPTPQHSDRNSAHVDLLPTILDLMGLPADARHRGRSVFVDAPPRRVLLGGANGEKFIGFVDGDQKLILNRTAGQVEFYDLAKDPEELDDVHAALDPAELDKLLAELSALAEGQERHLRKAPSLPTLDVERSVYDQASVQLRRGDQLTACQRGPQGWTCGSDAAAGPRLVVAPPAKRQAQSRRYCAAFAPPPGAVIEMSLREAAVLPLLARVRVTALDEPGADLSAGGTGESTIGVAVDDGPFSSRSLKGKGDKRISHKTPSSSWTLRIEGGPPLCVTFSDQGWRP